jgi:hypothetical protein
LLAAPLDCAGSDIHAHIRRILRQLQLRSISTTKLDYAANVSRPYKLIQNLRLELR